MIVSAAQILADLAPLPPTSHHRRHWGLRIGEAADMAGVSIKVMRRLARDGRVRYTLSSGGQLRFDEADVRALAAGRRP